MGSHVDSRLGNPQDNARNSAASTVLGSFWAASSIWVPLS
jgi:hypothetical protein